MSVITKSFYEKNILKPRLKVPDDIKKDLEKLKPYKTYWRCYTIEETAPVEGIGGECIVMEKPYYENGNTEFKAAICENSSGKISLRGEFFNSKVDDHGFLERMQCIIPYKYLDRRYRTFIEEHGYVRYNGVYVRGKKDRLMFVAPDDPDKCIIVAPKLDENDTDYDAIRANDPFKYEIRNEEKVGQLLDKYKCVEGDTYNVRGIIKKHGFRWDRNAYKWVK